MKDGKRIQVARTTSIMAAILFASALLASPQKQQLQGTVADQLNKAIKELAHKGLTITSREDLQLYIQIGQKVLSECMISLHLCPVRWVWRANAYAHKLVLDLSKENGNMIAPHNILIPREKHWIDIIKDKKVLIISKYCNAIRDQIQHRDKIYNKAIFPDCSFDFVNIPICGGKLGKTIKNYLNNELCTKAHNSDIVLIGDTPYSYCILDYMRQLDKSVIDVGDLLSLYFGVYNVDILTEYPDLIRVYLNKNWTKI